MKINFSLFRNTYKEKESHPDYVASVFNKETGKSTKIGGAWLKADKNGNKFLSVSLDDEWKPKDDAIQMTGEQKPTTVGGTKPEYNPDGIDPDSIPF